MAAAVAAEEADPCRGSRGATAVAVAVAGREYYSGEACLYCLYVITIVCLLDTVAKRSGQ